MAKHHLSIDLASMSIKELEHILRGFYGKRKATEATSHVVSQVMIVIRAEKGAESSDQHSALSCQYHHEGTQLKNMINRCKAKCKL